MQKFTLFLFSIPVVSFVVIAIYQVVDEMFKKQFFIERRARHQPSELPPGVPRRRYSDAVAQGTPRQPEVPHASAAEINEISVPQVNTL